MQLRLSASIARNRRAESFISPFELCEWRRRAATEVVLIDELPTFTRASEIVP